MEHITPKAKKSEKVNRFVSLFEISRPNRKKGLERTNSLPPISRSFSLNEDIKNYHEYPFYTYLRQEGKVKKIKEEIERKSMDNSEIPSTSKTPKKKSKKKNTLNKNDSNNEEETKILEEQNLEEEKRKIRRNLKKIRGDIKKIKDVSEKVKDGETELELTFIALKHNDGVVEDVCGNVDTNIKEDSSINSDTVLSRLNSETGIDTSRKPLYDEVLSVFQTNVVNINGDSIFSSDYPQNGGCESSLNKYIDDVPVRVINNISNSESINSSDSTNNLDNMSYVILLDNIEMHDLEKQDKETNSCNSSVSEDKIDSGLSWVEENNRSRDNLIDKTSEDSQCDTEACKNTSNESPHNVESPTPPWKFWLSKSFVSSNTPARTLNEEPPNVCPESRTSTLERKHRFIKNQTLRRSTKKDHRRPAIVQKSQTVKELTKHFESFKDAEEQGETENFRKSFIEDMDRELENMRLDGFKEDFHLSMENLNLLDNQENENLEEGSSSKDESPYYQTFMFLRNSTEEEPIYENIDDPFGETLFTEDLDHEQYFVEAYNADGKELMINIIQISQQSVDLAKLNELKSSSKLNLLSQPHNQNTLVIMGNSEASTSQTSLNESNNGTDSKRTTIYSTTSGDSNEDDEGYNSNSYTYAYGARRETISDDNGIIRIERFGPNLENINQPAEYENTTNHYYSIDELGAQNEENYYETIQQLEHQITVFLPEVKKETLQYILEEIKVTEKKYVNDMKKVIKEYQPFLVERCPDKIAVVFGNIEQIYKKQKEFLEVLENSEDDVKEIVQAFIDFEDLFRIYPRYFRNTPKANAAIKELAPILAEKQQQINDRLDISAYLLTPLQRLGKYKLFLENIFKQLEKEKKSTMFVQLALDIIKKYLSRGNDAVAIASILHSPLHAKDYGSFIARENFTMIKPKRTDLMVFLFEEVIVFTTEDQKNMEQFIYSQSIKTNDLRIATFDDCTLHLTDYTKTKKKNSAKYTFILDAKTQKVKNAWKQYIEDILWKQLQKVKENTLKDYQTGKNNPKKAGRSRIKSTEEQFKISHNSIQCCPFDITGYGEFLLMDEFKVRKPKKMLLMVFLFEKIIIFTKKQKDEDSYYYVGSVHMNQLSLSPVNKDPNVLEIKDHVTSVKFHKDIVFKLEASNEYIQKKWRQIIEKCLWSQLLKAKMENTPKH